MTGAQLAAQGQKLKRRGAERQHLASSSDSRLLYAAAARSVQAAGPKIGTGR